MRLRARLSLVGAGVFLVVVILAKPLLQLFAPFLIALFLVAIMDPFVTRLEKEGVPRGIGAFLGIAFIGFIIVASVWVIISNLLREAQHFIAHLETYAARSEELVASGMHYLNDLLALIPHPLGDMFLRGTAEAIDSLGMMTSQIIAKVGGIPALLFMGVVALTTTYFLSRDKRLLGEFAFRLIPGGWHPEIRRLKEEIFSGLVGFVHAQMILIGVSMTLSLIGLLLFRIPYAWILGTLAGILDIVPMVGPSGVFVPVIVWLIVMSDWPRVFGLLCVWLIVLLLRQIIEPQVVGKHVGLHPLTSIASMYVGGVLLGANGLIIGPVVAITIKAIFAISIFPYLKNT